LGRRPSARLFAHLTALDLIFQNVWKFDPITEATFKSAEAFLTSLGYAVNSDTSIKLLGISEFDVLVGPQCSGVEGFLLISAFLSFYIWLFKTDLRFPRVWLLLPIGLALSWIFNVVRISALIMMGHHMSFTAHKINWFRKSGVDAPRNKKPGLPLADDPAAAQILPFIIFMASALLLSTFTELPGLYYPIRFVAMVAVLAFFHRYLKALPWRFDPVAISAGAIIGVLWLLTAPAANPTDTALSDALSTLGGFAFVIWVISRVIGTSLLVPIIEELFFRGYVQASIDDGRPVMRILAFAISSGLFAALHGRWVEAFLAGTSDFHMF